MAIRAGYNINNIERLLERKENCFEVENKYTEELLSQELPEGIKLEAVETQAFDSWVEYYTLYSISKDKLKDVPKYISVAISKVMGIFKGYTEEDIMIDSIDCSLGDSYYVLLFSRTY